MRSKPQSAARRKRENLGPSRRILVADCWTIMDAVGRYESGEPTADDCAVVAAVSTVVKIFKWGVRVPCIVCGESKRPGDAEIIAIHGEGPFDRARVRAGVVCHECLESRGSVRERIEEDFGTAAFIVEPAWEIPRARQ